MSKLCIGTAQFGLNYGVTNKSGQVSAEGAREILHVARTCSIDSLDTASSYGSSEVVLGHLGASSSFQVVTKFSPENNIDLSSQLETSLRKLESNSVYGYISHDADFFISHHKALVPELWNLKELGKVKKIGCSVYTPDQLDRVLSLFKPDLIQLPMNVFDQRFLLSGALDQLQELGVEVHTRSAFLQGILLEDIHSLNPYFKRFQKNFEVFFNELENFGLSSLEACLSLLIHDHRISKVIVGVCSVSQLEQIIESENRVIVRPELDYARFVSDELDLILPPLWRLS